MWFMVVVRQQHKAMGAMAMAVVPREGKEMDWLEFELEFTVAGLLYVLRNGTWNTLSNSWMSDSTRKVVGVRIEDLETDVSMPS